MLDIPAAAVYLGIPSNWLPKCQRRNHVLPNLLRPRRYDCSLHCHGRTLAFVRMGRPHSVRNLRAAAKAHSTAHPIARLFLHEPYRPQRIQPQPTLQSWWNRANKVHDGRAGSQLLLLVCHGDDVHFYHNFCCLHWRDLERRPDFARHSLLCVHDLRLRCICLLIRPEDLPRRGLDVSQALYGRTYQDRCSLLKITFTHT